MTPLCNLAQEVTNVVSQIRESSLLTKDAIRNKGGISTRWRLARPLTELLVMVKEHLHKRTSLGRH